MGTSSTTDRASRTSERQSSRASSLCSTSPVPSHSWHWPEASQSSHSTWPEPEQSSQSVTVSSSGPYCSALSESSISPVPPQVSHSTSPEPEHSWHSPVPSQVSHSPVSESSGTSESACSTSSAHWFRASAFSRSSSDM